MMIFDHGEAVRRLFDRDRDEVRIETPHEAGGDACTIKQYDRENLDVQVRLAPKGLWHKKAIGGKHTACGRPLGGFASRDETYAGELCESCFTTFELIELSRLANDDDLQPADMTSIYDEEGTYPWRKR